MHGVLQKLSECMMTMMMMMMVKMMVKMMMMMKMMAMNDTRSVRSFIFLSHERPSWKKSLSKYTTKY